MTSLLFPLFLTFFSLLGQLPVYDFFEPFCALASVMVLIDRVATLLSLVLSSFPSIGIILTGVLRPVY